MSDQMKAPPLVAAIERGMVQNDLGFMRESVMWHPSREGQGKFEARWDAICAGSQRTVVENFFSMRGVIAYRPKARAALEEEFGLSVARVVASDPHAVTRQFEAALCQYTGARFAVTTTSCTQAILMALAWRNSVAVSWRKDRPAIKHLLPDWDPLVVMPKLSYVGVPAAIANAGMKVLFRDEDWQGEYRLEPFEVWDSARRFTSGMFRPGAMQCVSFHASKILGDSQGGAILHDDPQADVWLRRARFDGRTEGADPKTDQVQYPSWHAYMSPDVAARLLWKLSVLPLHNPDLPRSDYPDLSTMEAFR